jgi:addiction module HigA family antidote
MTTESLPRTTLAIPPGEFLKEELLARHMTQRQLAAQIGRPVHAVGDVVRARRAITPALALDLERALGASAEFWLNLEARYRLTLLRQRSA